MLNLGHLLFSFMLLLLAWQLNAETVGENTVKIDGRDVPMGAIGYKRVGSNLVFQVKPEFDVTQLAPSLLKSPYLVKKLSEVFNSQQTLSNKDRVAWLKQLDISFNTGENKGPFSVKNCEGYLFSFSSSEPIEKSILTIFDPSSNPLIQLSGVRQVECYNGRMLVKAKDVKSPVQSDRYYFFSDQRYSSSIPSLPGDKARLIAKASFPPGGSFIESTLIEWKSPSGSRSLYHPHGHALSRQFLKPFKGMTREVMIFVEGVQESSNAKYHFVNQKGDILLTADRILDHLEFGPIDAYGNETTKGYFVIGTGKFRDLNERRRKVLPEPFKSATPDEAEPALLWVNAFKYGTVLKSSNFMKLRHVYIEIQKFAEDRALQATTLSFLDENNQERAASFLDGFLYPHSYDFIAAHSCEGVTIAFAPGTKDYVVRKAKLEKPLLISAGLNDVACNKRGEIGLLYFAKRSSEEDSLDEWQELKVFHPDGSLKAHIKFDKFSYNFTSLDSAIGQWWRAHNAHYQGISIIANAEDETFYETNISDLLTGRRVPTVALHALLHRDIVKIGTHNKDVEMIRVAKGESQQFETLAPEGASILKTIESRYSKNLQKYSREDFGALLKMSHSLNSEQLSARQTFDDRYVQPFFSPGLGGSSYRTDDPRSPFDTVYLRWERADKSKRRWMLMKHSRVTLPDSKRQLNLTAKIELVEDLSKAPNQTDYFTISAPFDFQIEAAAP